MVNHTPLPWRWEGEDYRGGWGWQLLVGPNGEGVICGQGEDGGPYRHLKGYVPVEPRYCKTGMYADSDSAPCVHVRKEDAELIVRAVNCHADLLAACEAFAHAMREKGMPDMLLLVNALHLADEAVRKAKGG